MSKQEVYNAFKNHINNAREEMERLVESAENTYSDDEVNHIIDLLHTMNIDLDHFRWDIHEQIVSVMGLLDWCICDDCREKMNRENGDK